MWTAANDGSATSRRRRHRDKRRRTGDGDDGGGVKGQDVHAASASNDNDEDIGSDSDSDSSTDGERSTTESVHEEQPAGDDNGELPSTMQPAQGGAAPDQSTVAAGGPHEKRSKRSSSSSSRKRKRRKKRKKKKQTREETPEATMARLQSSYSAAMSAVGALHRVSHHYCAVWKEEVEGKRDESQMDINGGEKKKDKAGELAQGDDVEGERAAIDQLEDSTMDKSTTAPEAEAGGAQNDNETTQKSNEQAITTKQKQQEEARSTIQRVARAARTALEQSLLLDHVILAPIFLPEKKNKRGKKTKSTGKNENNDDATFTNDISMETTSSAWLDAWNNSKRNAHDATAGSSSNATCKLSLMKWNRLSAAHRTVTKQISYLALVNYADLLLCGCMRRQSKEIALEEGGQAKKRGDILDRGAVSTLDVLDLFSLWDRAEAKEKMIESTRDGAMSNDSSDPPAAENASSAQSSSCLWANDSTEQTIRLALAAYCDASELDSTDPTLWFKLACAARALGREIDCRLSSSSTLTNVGPPQSYLCLERLALERGISSLPQGVPPNRLLMRAWKEMEYWGKKSTVEDVVQVTDMIAREDALEDDVASPTEDGEKRRIELVLHLPRYSWAILGRILMRACREGVSYGRSCRPGGVHHVWSTNCRSPEDYNFGSPLLDMRISPLLAIPPGVMGIICEYLDESADIKRLTCTCRAMPSELASATAKVAEEKKRSSLAIDAAKDAPCPDESAGKDVVEEGLVDGTGAVAPVGGDQGRLSSSNTAGNQREEDFIPPQRFRERVSVRVLSQMMTSSKKTERKSKRSSVEYCLLAGILSCTAQNPNYTKLLGTDFDWELLRLVKYCSQKLQELSQALLEPQGLDTAGSFHADKNMQSSSHMDQNNAFIASTSLNAFIASTSLKNSGPRNVLDQFLVHVSLNTGDVFETDIVDSLSSCVTDCFDMMTTNADRYTPWYGMESFDGNLELATRVLAVNLLSAELRFKRCESHDIGSHEHQEDSDVLAFIIPNLLHFVSTLSQSEVSIEERQNILPLQCRFYWLASSYHLWIGRCSNDSSISCDAENAGLTFLDRAMALLSELSLHRNGLTIKTPHLKSPARRGDHWSELSTETLSKYREHLQSSSIVSRARQLYQEIQNGFQSEADGDETGNIITADDKLKFASLSTELLERYAVNGEKSTDVIEELLNDFLLLHEDHLHAPDANNQSSPGRLSNWKGQTHWGEIWAGIPLSKAAGIKSLPKQGSRPSIIQVLTSSLIILEEKASSIFLILSKLVYTALLSRARARTQAQRLRRESDSSDSQIDFEESKQEGTDDWKFSDTTKTSNIKRDQLMLLAANLFTDKMTEMIKSNNDAELHNVLEDFAESGDFCSIIFSFLNASLFEQADVIENLSLQIDLFRSSQQIVLALRECDGLASGTRQKIESIYFVTLVKSIIRQKREFTDLKSSASDKRLKKWQIQMCIKADLISFTATEIAELLSLNPSSVNEDGSVCASHLIKAITDSDVLHSQSCQSSPLAQFSEALLWFWKFLYNTFDASSPTENLVRNRLMVPISSAIIALCGSPGVSIADGENFNLADYFDSEHSIYGVAMEEDNQDRRRQLRKFCQLTQCASLVFESVDEKLICQESSSIPFPSSMHGSFLPLVVVRVLSSMGDGIFELFGESVWGKMYPYGARECGNTIDRILGKAYLHLYGFSFSGAEDTSRNRAPESIKAATQLFRCIKRVYHENRRSPPRKAFETIESALPPATENKVSKALRAFLFSAEAEGTENITDIPSCLKEIEWVFSEAHNVSHDDDNQNEVELLRRGICQELAKGPITNLDSNKKSPSDMDDQGLSVERELTQSHELSLDQKFKAVLESLCYEPTNIEKWIVLSECCGFKAEYICDRLGPIKEEYDSSEFCLKMESKRMSPATMTLDQLRNSQYEIYQQSRKNWCPFIGNNLYVYMKYPWSNLSSLQACANEIGSTLSHVGNGTESSITSGENSDYLCWKEIESKFQEGNYAVWANAWAGVYVMALRTMRAKALLVARYIAKRNQGGMHPSEVSEDLGTVLYCDLMASTVYGYPMHPMTDYEKRKIAERSLSAFQEAIELSTSNEYTQKSQTTIWEIKFMTGKCCEKIATTLREEIYSSGSTESGRLYEKIMSDAIRNYSESLAGAREAEKTSGGPDKTCIGGSSHGALECLYRLHSSRFKVLLAAIRRIKEECEIAELEAFRIASLAWFDESNQSSTGVRGQTWDVLADCVDALTHCRREIPLFHRAAYRLAQAYSWAPAFHNPDCDLTKGSKQAVPATKSYRIRGLDTESCAESAAVVMTTLFEKRRSQLCAVWVTTSTAPPPFEVLNDSLRKYDALRLKYISAFIDCMRVCGQNGKIETLLNCAITSSQDLPGFYEASASLRGGDPGKHARHSLLRGSGNGFITKVKRNAISAIGEMILKDLAVMKKNGVDNEGKMKLTHHFKSAYKLFRRLNTPCREVAEFIRSTGPLCEVQAFCKCYLSIQAGYRISAIHFDGMDTESLCSILEGAVSKAKSMVQEAKDAPKK